MMIYTKKLLKQFLNALLSLPPDLSRGVMAAMFLQITVSAVLEHYFTQRINTPPLIVEY